MGSKEGAGFVAPSRGGGGEDDKGTAETELGRKTVRQGANVDKVMAIWKWVCPKVVRTSFYLKSSHPCLIYLALPSENAHQLLRWYFDCT